MNEVSLLIRAKSDVSGLNKLDQRLAALDRAVRVALAGFKEARTAEEQIEQLQAVIGLLERELKGVSGSADAVRDDLQKYEQLGASEKQLEGIRQTLEKLEKTQEIVSTATETLRDRLASLPANVSTKFEQSGQADVLDTVNRLGSVDDQTIETEFEQRGQGDVLDTVKRLESADNQTVETQFNQHGQADVLDTVERLESSENNTVTTAFEQVGAADVKSEADEIASHDGQQVNIAVGQSGATDVQAELDLILKKDGEKVTIHAAQRGADGVTTELKQIATYDGERIVFHVDENGSADVKGKLKQLGDEGGFSIDQLKDAFGDLPGPIGDVLGKADDLLGMVGKSGSLAIGAAGLATAFIAFAIDAVAAFAEVDAAVDGLERKLNISEGEARELGRVAQDAFANNWFESVGQAADAVGYLRKHVKGLTDEEMSDVLSKAEAIASTYEKEFSEVASAAETLSRNFDIPYPEALDYIAKGFERGLDRSGDMLESIEEYSPQFANAQIGANGFFATMESGGQGGMLGVDKALDGIKELPLKLAAGSDALIEQLGRIGINYHELTALVDNGAITQGEAMQRIIDALAGVDLKVADSVIKSGELGTPFEDLGAIAVRQLNIVDGAFGPVLGTSDKVRDSVDDIGSKAEEATRGFATLKMQTGKAFAPLASGVLDKVNSGIGKVVDLSFEVEEALDGAGREGITASERFLRIVDSVAAINKSLGGFGDSREMVGFLNAISDADRKVTEFLGLEYNTPAWLDSLNQANDALHVIEDRADEIEAARSSDIVMLQNQATATAALAEKRREAIAVEDGTAAAAARSAEANQRNAELLRNRATAEAENTAAQQSASAALDILNGALRSGNITHEQYNGLIADGIPPLHQIKVAVDEYAEANRESAAREEDAKAAQELLNTALATGKITQEQYNQIVHEGLPTQDEAKQRIDAITTANRLAAEAQDAYNQKLVGFFNQALKTQEVDLSAEFTKQTQALGGNIEAMALMGVATGEFTEEQAAAAIKAALLKAKVQELTQAWLNGTMSLSDAIGAAQDFQTELANTDISIDTTKEKVDIAGQSLTDLTAEPYKVELTDNADEEIGRINNVQSTADALVDSPYFLDYTDNSAGAISRAGAVKQSADQAAGTRTITYNIVTNGQPPTMDNNASGDYAYADGGRTLNRPHFASIAERGVEHVIDHETLMDYERAFGYGVFDRMQAMPPERFIDELVQPRTVAVAAPPPASPVRTRTPNGNTTINNIYSKRAAQHIFARQQRDRRRRHAEEML